MVKKKITAKDVMDRLRHKYREELLIEEFSTPASSAYNNRADAILISCHPARSKTIEYFEIKVDRKDWLNELKNPSKSELLAQHCHKIWLVTSDESVAKMDEIPDNWGWMYPQKRKFKVLKKAPTLDAFFDVDFVIRVAQYTQREFNSKIIEAQEKALEEAKIDISNQYDKDYWKRQADFFKEGFEENKKIISTFEKTTGVYMHNVERMKEFAMLTKQLLELKDLAEFDSLFGWRLSDINHQIKKIEEAKKKIKFDIEFPVNKEK